MVLLRQTELKGSRNRGFQDSSEEPQTSAHYYEVALKIRPTFTQAMFNLGLCDYYEGKVDQAHARWQEVIKLDPSFAKARAALEQPR